MQPTDDNVLLRQYVEVHSDESFAALVTRHVNLVYSVALRHVGNPHDAEEITQAVFIILARKAASLRHEKALSSWLFQVTRLTANNFVRSEIRRHHREQEAQMQTILNESGSEVWLRIAPLLDGAVADLREKDRQAILLRFYEGRNLREIGSVLGASEDAAEKRVNRAVEKLRNFFTKKGVNLSAATIAGAVSANSVQAAPAGLAATITAAALSGTTITTAAVIAATKTVAMTTLQKAIVAATVAVLAGTGIYEARQVSALRGQNQTLQQQQAPLAEQIQQLQRERDAATNRLASMAEEIANINTNNSELLRLRSKLGLLKQTATELSNQVTKASNQYGLLPEQMPPVISSGVPETANAYARLVKKLATGHLSAAEEFNLLKAWPYLERRFSEPDAFASFQAEYLAATLDLKDDNVKWELRQILERARDEEHARGLRWARMSDEEIQDSNVQLDIQKIREQWNALSETTTQQIVQLLPEEQRPQFAVTWQVLDFDPRLKSGSQASLTAQRFQNLNPQEILQAFFPPNSKVHLVPATPLQKQ